MLLAIFFWQINSDHFHYHRVTLLLECCYFTYPLYPPALFLNDGKKSIIIIKKMEPAILAGSILQTILSSFILLLQ